MDKTKMFNRFAENLKTIKNKLGFEITGSEESNIFVCPLSMKVFSEEGLSAKYADQLTIEHVPPKSLGGKGISLTNKISNSQSGHTLDANLLKYLHHEDFKAGKGAIPVKYKFDKKLTIPGEITGGEKLGFSFRPKGMHEGAQQLLIYCKQGKNFQ